MKKAKSVSPRLDRAAVLARSETLGATQRLEEAERLLARFPKDAECVFRRGALLMTLERWAEAEACFRGVLTAVTGHFDSITGLAGALVEQGRPAEALPFLDHAVQTKPDAARLHYFRGVALEETGWSAEGRMEMTTARRMLIAQAERRDLMPREVYVQVSRRCNLRCAMCGHEAWKETSGFMEDALFDRILEQCATHKIPRINILAAQGEPMLHPGIFEMLDKAVAGGFDVHIVTNGTPFTPERIERLAKMGLASIQFSFAGWDKDSYEKTYIGSKFERTLANLTAMQAAVRGTKTDFFVKAVVASNDWANVCRRTRTFLNEQGIDKVFAVLANNFGGTVACGRFNEQHGVWSLKNLDHHRRMPCRVFLSAVGILCDGAVTACACYDSNAVLKIGDITRQGLDEIRHGEAFRRILEGFRKGDMAGVPMCSTCDDAFG